MAPAKKKTEETKPDTRNVYQRLRGAMLECTYVQKDEQKKGMQYRAVSHDAVTAKVRPALVNHGIVYITDVEAHVCNGNRTETDISVTFINTDDPDDRFTVRSFGYGVDNQDKGPGKAVSYAVKYALLKVMGLETGDDADNESIEYRSGRDSEPGAVPDDGEDRMTIAQRRMSAKSTLMDFCGRNGFDPKLVGAAMVAKFGKKMDAMDAAQLDAAIQWVKLDYQPESGDKVSGDIPGEVV